jgi:alanine dehydrogenase
MLRLTLSDVRASGETIVLTRSDVERLVEMEDAIDAVEAAFRAHGEGRASNLTRNFAVNNNVASIKVGLVSDLGRVGLKSLGLVVLCADDQLRRPLAIMEQAPITYLRTGAAGAIAAKYLARRDCRRVGVLGSGRQARAQLGALTKIFDLDHVTAWSPTSEHRQMFAREMCDVLGVPVIEVDEPQVAVEGQDIVVTATRAREPIVANHWVSAGTHINAIGADLPGSQELPADLLERAEVFADDVDQALWMGAVNVPITRGALRREIVRASLGQVIAGRTLGRTGDAAITVFDCSGLGMMDVALAQRVYERARTNPAFRRVDWFA